MTVGQWKSVPRPNILTTTATYIRGKEALKETLIPLFIYIGAIGVIFILESKKLKRAVMKQIT